PPGARVVRRPRFRAALRSQTHQGSARAPRRSASGAPHPLSSRRPGGASRGIAVPVKKRRTFMIDPDVLDKLRAIKDRTGLSESEQVRQGIQWWLESREWPPRRPQEPRAEPKPKPPAPRSR